MKHIGDTVVLPELITPAKNNLPVVLPESVWPESTVNDPDVSHDIMVQRQTERIKRLINRNPKLLNSFPHLKGSY